MDFQCDRCGQKYHVADEKLQGRAASRFKCKKCENVVLLTGPGTATPSVLPPASSPSGSPLRASTVTGPVRMISATPAPSTSAAPAPRPSVMPGAAAPAKPRPATTTGPAYGHTARPSVTPAAAARLSHAPAAPDPDEMGWFAGIRDIPVGPITRAEMVKYIEAGEATSETLVWRDGFADWRPLRLVPAFKDLALAQAQRPSTPSFHENEGDATTVTSGPALMAAFAAQAPAEPQTEAPTRRLSALTDEAALRAIRLPPPTGEKPSARLSAPAPAPRPSTATPAPAPGPVPAPAARTGAPVGAPLGAPKPSPLAKPLGAPMRTPTVATPSIGARPAPTGPALGQAPRTSAPPAPPPTARKLEPLGARPADPSAAPTPPRATPVAHGSSPLAKPLGPAVTARPGGVGPSPLAKPLAPFAKPAPQPEPAFEPPPPAPAIEPPSGLDALDALDALAESPAEHAPVFAPVVEPPTVVTAPVVVEPPTEILASSEALPLAAPTFEAPAPTAPPGVKVGGAQWDDPLFHVSAPPPAATSSPAPAARSSDPAKPGWNDPVFNSLPPAAAAVAVAVPSLAPAPSVPPHGVTTAQIPVTVDVDRAKPKGFPKGVLVLAAGLAVVGVAGGIALSRPKPVPQEPRPAAHAPVAMPTPATEPAAQPTPATEPAAQPTPAEPAAQPADNPGAPDMAFAGPGSDSNRPGHGGSRRTPRPQATSESQAATQAALERALGIRGGAAPPPSTQIATPPLRNTVAAPNAPGAAQANNPPPASAARSLDREQRAQSAIERSGVIRRCWEQFKLRNPAATRRSLTINFAVSAAGAVTLRVPNTSEPALSNCIERGSRDVRSLGDGSPSSGSTRADLD